MGIVGYGTIGKRVAQVAAAFGMKVLVKTRNILQPAPDYVTFVRLGKLLKNADVVSLHCPLTEKTRYTIRKINLNRMKSNAILINTGRGGLIYEKDLIYALEHGVISGAALDVLTEEPPDIQNPLLYHNRCIVTPHIAWAGQNARKILLDGITENIRSFLGGTLINKV
jgi:glycerate dehydrogenase